MPGRAGVLKGSKIGNLLLKNPNSFQIRDPITTEERLRRLFIEHFGFDPRATHRNQTQFQNWGI